MAHKYRKSATYLTPVFHRVSKSAPAPGKQRRRRSASHNNGRHTHTVPRSNRPRTKLPKNKYAKRMKSDYTKRANKKVGPREVGRSKYKGSKYNAKNDGDWLGDKMHHHARSSSFAMRKKKNPVKKKETVQSIGTPNSWNKPSFFHKEVEKMNSGDDWLQEKPMSVKNYKYERLKNTKVPKGKSVKQYGSPNSWKPIEFTYKNGGGTFLNEKLWFEGSSVQIESGLARIIEALPPKKKMELNKMPSPTGYQSKIAFIKKLRDIVMEEVRNMHREERLFQKLQKKKTEKQLKIITESDEDDDFTDIEQFVDEISKDLDKQLDDAMNEVLAEMDDTSKNEQPKKKNKKKKKVNFNENVDINTTKIEKPKPRITFSDVIKYQESKDEDDDDSDNKKRNKTRGGKDSMTLLIDVDTAIDDISDDSGDDTPEINEKYEMLLKRKNNEVVKSRRKLFTIKSVNKLNDLIDDLEIEQTSGDDADDKIVEVNTNKQ